MMIRNNYRKWAALPVAILLLYLLLTSACENGDAQEALGLSRAEVQEIARAEVAAGAPEPGLTSADVERAINEALAAQPQPGVTRADVEGIVNDAIDKMAEPEPGLTRADVEEIVRAAIETMPQPQPGVTRADVEEIVRAAIAYIPSKSSPAEYTQHFVDNAIARYEAQGLDATLAYYNSPQSVDGQWYVFMIDENDLVIGHPDPERLGLDLKGWVGTDANGYEFGPEMLAATEDGKWVSYVYRNPENGGIGSGDFELKNAWVVKRDGLLFASGWYIDADEFTRMLVSVALDNFREGGLPATVAYFASPGSALAGLEEAIDYYNAAETVDGRWSAFIGDPDGNIVAHSDVSLIGGDVQDLLGGETFQATEEGVWVESESLRIFVAGYDGYVFGSGWSRDE